MIVNGRPITGLFIYDSQVSYTKGDLFLVSESYTLYVVHQDYCGALNGPPETSSEYCTEYNQFHYGDADNLSESDLVLGSTLNSILNKRFSGLSGNGYLATIRKVTVDQLNSLRDTGAYEIFFDDSTESEFGDTKHAILRVYKLLSNSICQEILDFENGIIYFRVLGEDDTIWTTDILPINNQAYLKFRDNARYFLEEVKKYVQAKKSSEEMLSKFNYAGLTEFEELKTDFINKNTCSLSSSVLTLTRIDDVVYHFIISKKVEATDGVENTIEQFPATYYLTQNMNQDNIIQLDDIQDSCSIKIRSGIIEVSFSISSDDEYRVEYVYVSNPKRKSEVY
jgi:hypothetical protein